MFGAGENCYMVLDGARMQMNATWARRSAGRLALPMPDAEALEGVLEPMAPLMLPGTVGALAKGVPLPGKGMAGCAWFEGNILAGIGATTTGCAGTRGLLSAGSGPGVENCAGAADLESVGTGAGTTPAPAQRMPETSMRPDKAPT